MALTRKRSRLDLDLDDDEYRQPVPASPAFSDNLKRTKTLSELDELSIASPEAAWSIDVSSILSSETFASCPDRSLQAHTSPFSCAAEPSIVVMCVQGNLHLHYDLLW
jgi:hypothetical protein